MSTLVLINKTSRAVCLAALLGISLVGCGGAGREAGGQLEDSDLSELASEAEAEYAGREIEGNACDLITADEIAASVGNPVDQGRSRGSLNCMWDSEKLEEVSVSLTAFVKQEGARPMEEICRDMRTTTEDIERDLGSSVDEIAGLGDEAWWTFSSTPALNSAQLWTCKKSAVLGLTLSGGLEESAMLEAARALASRAFGRV